VKTDDIRKFLDGYAAARKAGDLDAIEAHFALPLILATKNGTTFIEDEAAFDEALAAEQAGGNPTAFDPYEITPLPDGAARVRARWTLADGSLTEKAYTLAEDDDGVIAIVAIEADG
jgi:hypothetical protein